MKALKWIFLSLAALVVLAVVVVVIGLNNLDRLVVTAVERAGTEVTGSKVGLQAAKISLKEGRAELGGLSIANPQGFSNALLLDVKKIAVDIDPSSLTNDVIVIDEVMLSGIKLLAEQKALTQTNIEALLNNIKSNTAKASSQQKSGAQGEEGKPVLLAIKRFEFEQSTLKLATEEWGDTSLALPPIILKNLGSPEAGLTPQQLARQVSEPVLQQVKQHMRKQLEALAREKAKAKAQEALQEKIDDKLSGSEKEVLNQLKGLFN